MFPYLGKVRNEAKMTLQGNRGDKLSLHVLVTLLLKIFFKSIIRKLHANMLQCIAKESRSKQQFALTRTCSTKHINNVNQRHYFLNVWNFRRFAEFILEYLHPKDTLVWVLKTMKNCFYPKTTFVWVDRKQYNDIK